MFLDYGTVYIDRKKDVPNTSYSYINGTIKVTYDYPNQRSYVNLRGAEVFPLVPGPSVPYHATIINDYKNVSLVKFSFSKDINLLPLISFDL